MKVGKRVSLDVAAVRHLYEVEMLNQGQIAYRLGCSKTQVHYFMRANGIKARRTGFPRVTDDPSYQERIGTSYGPDHEGADRKYGQPSVCSHCGSVDEKKYVWATLGHMKLVLPQPLVDIPAPTGFRRLCDSCHKFADNGNGRRLAEQRR